MTPHGLKAFWRWFKQGLRDLKTPPPQYVCAVWINKELYGIYKRRSAAYRAMRYLREEGENSELTEEILWKEK